MVGAGRWGMNHVRTLDELGVLGGIVDNDSSRLKELESIYPNVESYSDIREAFRRPFDGFTVATPSDTHHAIAKVIIQNKKHVLVEKPLALSVKDARELHDLAAVNNVNMMVGHLLLFHPAIQRIKNLLDEGKIGKMQYIYSNRLNLGAVRTEENILWNFAPHDISVFQFLIGEYPVKVTSRGGAFLQPHLHDTTMTILKYPDNVVAHIFVSWLHPFKEHRLIVIGSQGMLSFEDSSEDKTLLYYEKGVDWIKGKPVEREGATEVIDYEAALPLTEELFYFIDHLDGRPVKTANGENGIEILKILEEATASLLSGA